MGRRRGPRGQRSRKAHNLRQPTDHSGDDGRQAWREARRAERSYEAHGTGERTGGRRAARAKQQARHGITADQGRIRMAEARVEEKIGELRRPDAASGVPERTGTTSDGLNDALDHVFGARSRRTTSAAPDSCHAGGRPPCCPVCGLPGRRRETAPNADDVERRLADAEIGKMHKSWRGIRMTSRRWKQTSLLCTGQTAAASGGVGTAGGTPDGTWRATPQEVPSSRAGSPNAAQRRPAAEGADCHRSAWQ